MGGTGRLTPLDGTPVAFLRDLADLAPLVAFFARLTFALLDMAVNGTTFGSSTAWPPPSWVALPGPAGVRFTVLFWRIADPADSSNAI